MGKHLLTVLLWFVGAAMATGVYKWVDERGRTVYSDKPAAGKAAESVEFPAQGTPQGADRHHQDLQRRKERAARPEETQAVLGTVSLAFVAHAAANLPEPPFKLRAVIKSVELGTVSKFDVTDPSPEWKRDARAVSNHQDFSFFLKPGSYELVAIEAEAPSLSDSPCSFGLRARRFVVPAGNCIYVGRIYFAFERLPPLPFDLMFTLVMKMAEERKKDFGVDFLPTGALLLQESGVDSPGSVGAWRGAEGGKQALARAREIGCVIRPAGS